MELTLGFQKYMTHKVNNAKEPSRTSVYLEDVLIILMFESSLWLFWLLIYCYLKFAMETQMDGHTNGQTNNQTDKQMDGHANIILTQTS